MFATHKPFYQHYQKHFNEFQQAFKYYSNRILNIQFKHFHKSHVTDSLFVWNEIFYLITIIGQIDQVSIEEQTQAFSKSKVSYSLLYTFLEQWDWLTCKSCTYFLFTCAFIPSAIAYFLFFYTIQLLIQVGCLCLAMQLHDPRQLDQFGYQGLQLGCHQHH